MAEELDDGLDEHWTKPWMTDKIETSGEICITDIVVAEAIENEWYVFDSLDKLDELGDACMIEAVSPEDLDIGWYISDSADNVSDESVEAEDKLARAKALMADGKGRPALMADANYYNKALFKIVEQEGGVFIEAVETGRYLFDSAPGIASEGAHVAGRRGQDGGWVHGGIKPAIMADANYYNKALWKIVEHNEGVLIESVETGRYLFDSARDDHVGDKREQDGGWVHEDIKPAVMADANYYNKALWKIVPHERGILIESVVSGRYLFDSAPGIASEGVHVGDKRGHDGGWVNEEANYPNKMIAAILEHDSAFLIESVETGRYLFDSAHGVASDGVHVGDKREQEGGWAHKNVKPTLMSDANYNNKALWKIVKHCGCFLIESVETGRYLFDPAHVADKRGQESGWVHEDIKSAVTADANYYNRALWRIAEQDGCILIESVVSGRYLFDSAPGIASEGVHVGDKRGQECGWVHKNVKPAVMADANYYNKALWKIVMP